MASSENPLREELLRSIDGPDWATRAKSTERIAALYCRSDQNPAHRRSAEDGFRVLRYDGEAVVRRLLAECLKNAAHLPRDIALALATDKADIAVPFIERSPALEDHDLLAVLRDHPGPHRIAIARRPALSGQVGDALCRSGDEAVVLVVLANTGAAIADATLRWLADRYPRGTALHEAVAQRKLLPISIGARLRASTERSHGARAPGPRRRAVEVVYR